MKIDIFFKRLEQCKGPNYYIPTKESIHYTMHRIIGAALLLDKVKYMK